MSVETLEELYPYLRGHIFVRVVGSRSPSCAFCGAFRSQHPPDRQGSLEALPESEVRRLLQEIDRQARK